MVGCGEGRSINAVVVVGGEDRAVVGRRWQARRLKGFERRLLLGLNTCGKQARAHKEMREMRAHNEGMQIKCCAFSSLCIMYYISTSARRAYKLPLDSASLPGLSAKGLPFTAAPVVPSGDRSALAGDVQSPPGLLLPRLPAVTTALAAISHP